MKAVCLDFATVSRGDLDTGRIARLLPQIALHEVTPEADIARRITGAEIVLVNKLRITRERMIASGALRLIAVMATGTNNVDLEAARELGIAVCNVRNYCTTSLTQHVLAVILTLTHRLREYGRLAVDGSWQASPQFTMLDFPIRELHDRVLGIVGFGTLGRSVARAAEAALGMRVLVSNRPGTEPVPGRIELRDLLPQADVLSLHCPLTPATERLIGARELALMKPDALIVNTARGGLIDSQALADALRAGKIGGAAIDVLTQEPPVDGNPLLVPDIPNLLVTPHVAWSAREARQRCLDEVTANIEAFLRGEQADAPWRRARHG
ncbi:MAG TPA: D-2-hydroxyacid dehydrogenase, partial [Steroidobacteraceae bacterium]|nr:D-2-hydroxyacid dehydrogenase [Steroidobacteraceae bacterium]